MSFQTLIEDLEADMSGIKLPDGFISPQRAMHKLGLQTPVERGLGVAAGTAAVLYTFRPRFAFDEFGPRPFSLTSESKVGTLMHPAVLSLATGTAAALFL